MRSLGTWLTMGCVFLFHGVWGQEVAQILLCERVVENEAIGVRNDFQEDERAYAWLKLVDIDPSSRYIHIHWTLETETQHVEQLRISAPSWRTHCYKTLYKAGNWGVVVLSQAGDTLANRTFMVMPSGEIPLMRSGKLISELPPPPAGGAPPAQLTYPPYYQSELKQNSVLLPPSGGDSAQPQSVIVVFPGIETSSIARWQQWLQEQSGGDPAGLEQSIRQKALILLLPEEGTSGDETWEGMPAAIHRYEKQVFADIESLKESYPLAAEHVILLGEAWGADLAWAIGQRYPDQFAGAWLRDCKCSYYQQGSLQVQAAGDMRYVLERDTLSAPESLEMLEQSLRMLARARVSMQVWQQQQGAEQRPTSLRQVLGYLMAPTQER